MVLDRFHLGKTSKEGGLRERSNDHHVFIHERRGREEEEETLSSRMSMDWPWDSAVEKPLSDLEGTHSSRPMP